MNIDYQDTIDRYVRGEMSQAERAALEQRYAQDPELAEQLKHTQVVADAIKSREEKLRKMRAWREADTTAQTAATPSMERKWWIASTLSAAAILVLVILFAWPDQVNNPSPYIPSIDVSEYTGMKGGAMELEKIGTLINEAQYDEALMLIAEVQQEMQDDLNGRSEDADNSQAIAILRELDWLKANALLGADRRADALPLLQQLSQSEGRHQEEAKRLSEE